MSVVGAITGRWHRDERVGCADCDEVQHGGSRRDGKYGGGSRRDGGYGGAPRRDGEYSGGSHRGGDVRRPVLRLVPPLSAGPLTDAAPGGAASTGAVAVAVRPDVIAADVITVGPAAVESPAASDPAVDHGARPAGDPPGAARPGALRLVPAHHAAAEPALDGVRATGRTSAPVRLTRRGRIVVGMLLLALAIVVVALLAPPTQASPPAGPPRAVVVQSGDTLWSIASRALPGVPPYTAIAEVERLNHMPDATVYVGQQLILPPAG